MCLGVRNNVNKKLSRKKERKKESLKVIKNGEVYRHKAKKNKIINSLLQLRGREVLTARQEGDL